MVVIFVKIYYEKHEYKKVDYSTDKTIYEIPEDEEMPASQMYRMTVNFLMMKII